MTERAVVILLPGSAAGTLAATAGTTVRLYRDVSELRAALEDGDGPFVLCSDGLDPVELTAAAALIGELGLSVVEVRSERWDGASPSPLSAACRGVVSGFGPAGVAAAAALLRRESGA